MLYLRDTKSDIDTCYKVDYMRATAAGHDTITGFLVSEITLWVKDFCRFAYAEEEYVMGLIRDATTRMPEVKRGPVVSHALPQSPAPLPPPKKVKKTKKVKRAKLPVARVVKS
jgi:hypothetical protein